MLSWTQSTLALLSQHQCPYFFIDYSKLGGNDLNYFYQSLDEREKSRADSLINGNNYFIATRFILKMILEKLFFIRPNIQINAFGKPYASNIDCEFNVSHSGSAALIVLGGTDQVGGDLELIKKAPDLFEVSKIAFHKREMKAFFESGYQDGVFYQIWTRKEAALKALGVGIVDSLGDYYVEEKSPDCFALYKDGIDGEIRMIIVDVPIESQYAASLASTNPSATFVKVKIDPANSFVVV
jgi:phosphopantetheinyl transferase